MPPAPVFDLAGQAERGGSAEDGQHEYSTHAP